jgi:hypothetical protein
VSDASLSATLCLGVVDSIVERLSLVEVPGEEAHAFRVLRSPMVPDGSVGSQRIFRRAGVADLVYIGLTVPMIGLDSHMLFAFTPPGSPVPHFTLDSVAGAAGPPGPPPAAGSPPPQISYAFHLDLIPKVDLGANLEYLRHCFEPLTSVRAVAQSIEGLSPAHLSPTQYAVMSAWMLVHRANASAFQAVTPSVRAYLDHWFSLVENGVPASVLGDVDPAVLAARDLRNRAIVFDPGVDPVWARVGQLVGLETSELLRTSLAQPLP